jgi:putative membrane protein
MSTSIGDLMDKLAWTVAFVASSIIILGCGSRSAIVHGLAAFTLSGILGMAVNELPIPCTGIFGDGTLMFPMLTGLFGIPVLLASGNGGRIPAQRPPYDEPASVSSGFRGVLMGCVAGWFPGITSTVGASLSSCVFRERSPEDFISNVASIGTVTSVLSVVALSVSGSGRSGTAIVLRELSGDMISGIASNTFMVILLATAVSALAGYWLTMWSGNRIASTVSHVDMGLVNRIVLVVNVTLVLLLTGPCGLLILAVSSIIGLIPDSFGTSRIVLCGCLLTPVLIQIL